MSINDYSNSFDYKERIILELAKSLRDRIVDTVIEKVKCIKAGIQSGDDSGLENIWEEICVQFQTDYSAQWDLYDELVQDIVQDTVFNLADYELAALDYDGNFTERDSNDEINIDQITTEIVSAIYEKAVNDTSKNVVAFLENWEVY